MLKQVNTQQLPTEIEVFKLDEYLSPCKLCAETAQRSRFSKHERGCLSSLNPRSKSVTDLHSSDIVYKKYIISKILNLLVHIQPIKCSRFVIDKSLEHQAHVQCRGVHVTICPGPKTRANSFDKQVFPKFEYLSITIELVCKLK